MNLSETEREFLKEYTLNSTGISLDDNRVEFIEKNSKPILSKHQIGSLGLFIDKIKEGNQDIISEYIDLLTVNETHFLRDVKPFQILANQLIPQIIEKNSTNPNDIIRIWCSACSSGQEPYSIAISLLEKQELLQDRRIEIIATDICNKALTKARTGIYNQFEVQRGIPTTLLLKYFDKVGEYDWKIKDEVKKIVYFENHNLIGNHISLGTFHAIFCRNVLIYFDEQTKKKVLRGLFSSLKNDGFLFLGATETMNLCPEYFNQIESFRSLYSKKP